MTQVCYFTKCILKNLVSSLIGCEQGKAIVEEYDNF